MQALRILTNFGSFRKKSWQWRKIARNKLLNLLVLVIPQSFFLLHPFHNFEFSEEIAKSKSIILTPYFNTLIFKIRLKMNFGIVFKTSPPTDDISCRRNIRGIYWWSKILLLIFEVTKFSQRMENLDKNEFSSFCSIRWKFFKQTPLYSPENSKNILFLVLLSKMIIPEVIRA